jgi:hypothetical protein
MPLVRELFPANGSSVWHNAQLINDDFSLPTSWVVDIIYVIGRLSLLSHPTCIVAIIIL